MALPNPFAFLTRRTPDVTPPLQPRGATYRDDGTDGEVGASGTVFYSGFLGGEEYNADLRGDKGLEVYRKMMASDGMVKAMMRSLILPLRGAIAKFTPATEDQEDVDIAHVCEELLLNMEGQLWDDFIQQSFRGLGYGHHVAEQVWTRPIPGTVEVDGERQLYEPNLVELEGKLYLTPYRLAPRLQRSIFRWGIDRTGTLTGIQQRVWVSGIEPGTKVDPGDSISLKGIAATGTFHYIDIPAERLFVYTVDREGDNYTGESVLRAAYKHWYYKDLLIRIQAVAAERHGVGIPYAIVKQGIQKREEDAIVGAMRSLHGHEKGYLLINEAQLAEKTNLGMPPFGILDMRASGTRMTDGGILYHDRLMALSILADFLSLGSGTGGNANVMHRDKASMFFNALMGVKRPFEDAYNRQIVRPFVDMNFGPRKKYPSLVLSGIEARDLAQWATSLTGLANSGLLTPDPRIEQSIRTELDIPPLPETNGEPVYPDDSKDVIKAQQAIDLARARPASPFNPGGRPAPDPGESEADAQLREMVRERLGFTWD